jgi:hypothetical protein
MSHLRILVAAAVTAAVTASPLAATTVAPERAVPTASVAAPAAGSVSALAQKAVRFKNCTALNKKYRHGVGQKGARDKSSRKPVTNFTRNNALYAANRHLDRDHDKIACEKR